MSDTLTSMRPANECERVQWELACLEPGEALRVETSEHVSSCVECQAIAAELSGNREALIALKSVGTPEGILPAVQVELDRELARLSAAPGSHKWRWVAAAAVVLAVSTAAWQLTRVSPGSDETTAIVASAEPVTEIEPAQVPSTEIAEVAVPEPVASPATRLDFPAPERPSRAAEVPQEPVEVQEEAQEEVLAAVTPPAVEVIVPDFAPEEFRLPEFEPALPEPEPQKDIQTTMVKLLTEDPNVVIYWLIDSEASNATDGAKQRL